MASNKTRRVIPGVAVEIDGEQHLLRFNSAAIATLEDNSGLSISELLGSLQEIAKTKRLNVKFLLELIAAGLQHESTDWTWRTLGDKLELADVFDLVVPLMDALVAVFPAPPEKKPVVVPNGTEIVAVV